MLPVPVFLDFPGGSDGKESACNAGDLSLTPGLGRSPGGGMATHSRFLPRESPWTEAPGRLHSPRGPESQTRLRLSTAQGAYIQHKGAVAQYLHLTFVLSF